METKGFNTLVGVGGWAYIPIKHANKLEVCSKLYDFVEVNSTYYKLPPVEHAKKWRKTVGDDFEFTVRANATLTHVNHLDPTEENFRLHQKTMAICEELRASILHFQFPPTFVVSDAVVKRWRDFMDSTDSEKQRRRLRLHFAFEIRNPESSKYGWVRSFLSDYDIIPTTDAIKADELQTSNVSKIFHSRVFGFGYHSMWSFDSEELQKLSEKLEKVPARRRYVTFHNITMYEDASRMRNLVRTGEESALSSRAGIDSLKRTIALSRVKFPASKKALLRELSWRTFDFKPGKRVHVGKILDQLPEDKKFESLDEVLRSLPSL